jgi:hypothetical protein
MICPQRLSVEFLCISPAFFFLRQSPWFNHVVITHTWRRADSKKQNVFCSEWRRLTQDFEFLFGVKITQDF